MKPAFLALFLVTVLKLDVAAGQQVGSPLTSGTRLRLVAIDTDKTTGESRYVFPVGKFARYDGPSLILLSDSAPAPNAAPPETLHVPVTNVVRARAFTGLKRHAVGGAIAGLVIGTATGFWLGEEAGGGGTVCALFVGGNVSCLQSVPAQQDTRLARAGLGAGIGAVVGGVVGYLIRTEGWAEIDIGSLRLQAGLQARPLNPVP